MRFKDLLVVVDGKPAAQKRLDAALALASGLDAHLAALALVAEPSIPPIAGATFPADIMKQQRERAEAEATALLAVVRQKADAAGVSIELRQETALIDQWPHRMARHARHADMTIVGQADPDDDDRFDAAYMIEAAFMQSGRPALIVPYIGARDLPPRSALVCWDGSPEASRALNDSLPLIEKAAKVTLLIVDAPKLGSRLGAMPGADTATHLARHGINVEIKSVVSGSLSVGDVILGEASDTGADLVIMGGYGHSRLREMVLGGATQRLLENMTVPVLMAH